MKKICFILGIALLFFVNTRAQVLSKDKDPQQEVSKKVYSKVDVAASFRGGAAAWRTFLQNNLNSNIATTNGAPAGSYTVIIKFIVEMNGSLSNFTAVTNKGYGTESEAIRVLRNSSPWITALIGGNKVRSYFQQPITFVVP